MERNVCVTRVTIRIYEACVVEKERRRATWFHVIFTRVTWFPSLVFHRIGICTIFLSGKTDRDRDRERESRPLRLEGEESDSKHIHAYTRARARKKHHGLYLTYFYYPACPLSDSRSETLATNLVRSNYREIENFSSDSPVPKKAVPPAEIERSAALGAETRATNQIDRTNRFAEVTFFKSNTKSPNASVYL